MSKVLVEYDNDQKVASNQEASSEEEPMMSSQQAIYRVWLVQEPYCGSADTGSTKVLDPRFWLPGRYPQGLRG